MCFPGSITLHPEVFKSLVEDYISSYVHHGFDTIILGSSHGGNFDIMEEIAAEQAQKYPHVRIVCGCTLEELETALTELEEREGLAQGVCGGHACQWETSVMRLAKEECVRMDQAKPGFVGEVSEEVIKRLFQEGIRVISETGVIGDPSGADAEKGARYFQYTQDLQERAVHRHLAEWENARANRKV